MPQTLIGTISCLSSCCYDTAAVSFKMAVTSSSNGRIYGKITYAVYNRKPYRATMPYTEIRK